VSYGLSRNRRTTAALTAVSLALAVLGVLVPAAQARAQAGKVTIVKLKPLTVKVSGLKAGEAVTVKLTGAAAGSAKGTATAAGTATVAFPKAAVTKCSAFSVRATGTKGTTATFKSTVGTACKPTATVDFGASVEVVGSKFQPGEKLTVTLIAEGTHTKAATATATGKLTLSFGALPLSNCSAYTLKITGSKGSTFKKVQAALPC
jgi:hypothetical protein